MNIYGVTGERVLTKENCSHRRKFALVSLFLPQDKRELEQVKCELEQVKCELEQVKRELEQVKCELEQVKRELEQVKRELEQVKCELEQDELDAVRFPCNYIICIKCKPTFCTMLLFVN